MAGLSVTFRAVDELSAKMESMANAGNKALDSFERLGNAANNAFSDMDDSTRQIGEAVGQAASATDYWTDAVGNYNRDAMQAVWTTEELVEMGFMTEDALTQAASAVDDNSDSIRNLGDSTSDTKDEMEELGESAERAGKQSKEFGDNAKGAILSLEDVLKTVGVVAALKTIEDAFADCSKEAAAFETSVAMVSTVADTSVLSTAQLSAQITELSMQTGKGVNELAEATYNAISAGVDTSNAVATVGEATKLSTAGFTSSASALSVLTTALNAYQMEASEITNISDSLVMSQNLGVLTIDQMAHSMGKAISTASAYSVDLYNLESGYISLTKAGIGVEESTTYISSMLNELGKSSSKVSKLLVEETGESFGKLMEDGNSLADVLEIIYESVDRDSEAFMNLWGSAEAGKAGNAIINQGLDTFNVNLNKLANSAGTTQAAYEAMTNTAEHATERLGNSFANLKIAIGSDLNPTVSMFQNGLASTVDLMTEAINNHPKITALLTGAAVGIGTVTLGITAFTAATKIAQLCATTFGTTVSAMLGPVGLAAVAIGLVTAEVINLASAMNDSYDATALLASGSREMKEELDGLEDEYKVLEDAGKANTDNARELKSRIDDLTKSFNDSKETLADYINRAKELTDITDNMNSSYEKAMDSIDTEESNAKSLITQLSVMK